MKLRELLASILIPEKREATAYPYWIIIDPKVVSLSTYRARVHQIAASITGPFFSREAATSHMEGRRYHFSPHAVVFCASGHGSNDWKSLVHLADPELIVREEQTQC